MIVSTYINNVILDTVNIFISRIIFNNEIDELLFYRQKGAPLISALNDMSPCIWFLHVFYTYE